jgi:subtilisin family serine protease
MKNAARRVQKTLSPLDLIQLTALMAQTTGDPEVKIGLVDGPVALAHPDLAAGSLVEIGARGGGACLQLNSTACLHGTFIAGVLSARRGSPAPAISPGCTLLIRPIFAETASGNDYMPSAAPRELATAIVECMDAGARVVNLSVALSRPSPQAEQALENALHLAARRGVLIVAAAGNQAALGSSTITRHQWVIPVVACDQRGWPVNESNLGSSIGRRGLRAPGEGITSLSPGLRPLTMGGTSVAVPFVTGAIALLWSLNPGLTASQIRLALNASPAARPASVVPPLLDASAAGRMLSQPNTRRV